MRLTSICGLGQVALGPVMCVLGMHRGGTAARAPEGPRGHRDVAAVTGPAPTSSSPSGPWPRRSRASGRRGARAIETVPLAGAPGVVPAEPVRAPTTCPASPARRSTGTPCARPTPTAPRRRCPRSSSVTGAVAMGRAPEGEVGAGRARSRSRPAALLPARRRRGRDGRAHARSRCPGTSRSSRPVAPGDGRAARRRGGARRATSSLARRAPAARRGPRAAGRGGRDRGARARAPRAWRSSRPATRSSRRDTATLAVRPGARRARAGARRRSCARPAASPACAASSPTTRARSSACSRDAVARGDVVVVSAGLVGRRARPDRRPSSRRLGERGLPRARAQARASRRCWPTAAACR